MFVYQLFILPYIYVTNPTPLKQMQTGWEREGSGFRSQSALQTGLWRQNWEPAVGGGAAEKAQVKSGMGSLTVSSLSFCFLSLNVGNDFSTLLRWQRRVCLVSRSYLELELKKERRSAAASRQPSTPQRVRRQPESAPKVSSYRVKMFTAVVFVFTQRVHFNHRLAQNPHQPNGTVSSYCQERRTKPVWAPACKNIKIFIIIRGNTIFSPLLFTHLSLCWRSLSHHEDEQVRSK